MNSIFARIAALLLIVAVSGSLAGCGNKGPLVPPKAQLAAVLR
jgi:predicted small lipoprotein YifL